MTSPTDGVWKEAYYAVLFDACVGLGAAARALNRTDRPLVVRPPRPRWLFVSHNYVWPARGDGYTAWFEHVGHVHQRHYFHVAAEADCRRAANCILDDCILRPRRVLRALRRLQAAREWCECRAAGAAREIEEILRQQGVWHSQIMREYHLLQLGGGRRPPQT